MTKKLEELFGLNEDSTSENTVDQEKDDTISTELISQETLATIERVESALPTVKGLDATDKDLDEFSDLAKEAFNNLMDLGMQVDSRFSAEIFNSASSMLGHAIGAKTAKINKKLRMVDLQLKKAELERKLAAQESKNNPGNNTDGGHDLGVGEVIDRNELIRQVLAQVDTNKNTPKDK